MFCDGGVPESHDRRVFRADEVAKPGDEKTADGVTVTTPTKEPCPNPAGFTLMVTFAGVNALEAVAESQVPPWGVITVVRISKLVCAPVSLVIEKV